MLISGGKSYTFLMYFIFFSGLKELKVFMELATISAGENDADIDRLASFETAVMGYGPLLYSLPQNVGFKEFFDYAKQVLDTLNKDEKLGDKLVSFCKMIEFLIEFSAVIIIDICTPIIFQSIATKLCFF